MAIPLRRRADFPPVRWRQLILGLMRTRRYLETSTSRKMRTSVFHKESFPSNLRSRVDLGEWYFNSRATWHGVGNEWKLLEFRNARAE